MHPQVISDKPGVCPICGMELIKKVSDESSAATAAGDTEGMITLSKNKQMLSNVTLAKVQRGSLNYELTAYSYLDFAEQNRKLITARFNGRIEKLLINKSGQYVSKGQALFEIYSPEIIQAENEYLIALANANAGSLLASARKKLELSGVTGRQIEELEATKEVRLTMTYYSPVSGTVIEKKVQEGMYVNEGAVMYEVADMSVLWSISEVYEKDISSVKIGSKAALHLQAYPGKTFEGKVIFIYPVVNPGNRTVKVRSEFANRLNLLKPQMYGETVFKNNFGNGLLVPSGAVLFTGKRNVVWVRTSDGTFESRTVQVGNKFGDKYEVLSGLNEGDEVAASGGYLIDSESQLKTSKP